MARHRHLNLALTSLTLAGFIACRFGAEDFAIVPSDEAAAATGNQAGSSNANAGEGSGAQAAGGSATNEGGVGASSTGGAGGSGEGTPKFTCNPQAATFTVFSAAELENREIDRKPWLAATQGAVVVVVPTLPEGDPVSARVFFRSIADSQGGSLDSLAFYDVAADRYRVGGGAFVGSDLKILGATDQGIAELIVPTTGGGREFGTPSLSYSALPDECDSSGSIDGSVRDLRVSYDDNGTRGYAVTCAAPGDYFSLHVASPLTTGAIPAIEPGEINNIVRQYFKFGNQHLIVVGSEVGPRIGARLGSTLEELDTVNALGLSDDPNVYASFLMGRQPEGLFVHGAAFTTDEPNPPPLVPAQMYAGSVRIADFADLFTTGASGNVPPAPLALVATYTKASDLIAIDDTVPFGQNVLGAGATFSPRDRIKVMFLTKEGSVLAPPTAVYQAASGSSIEEHSVHVARLGLGAIVVWIEGGDVLARTITCLQD